MAWYDFLLPNRPRPTPPTPPPTTTTPTPPPQDNRQDYYYNIDNPNEQYTQPTGDYSGRPTPTPTPIPDRPEPNTNRGRGGGGSSGRASGPGSPVTDNTLGNADATTEIATYPPYRPPGVKVTDTERQRNVYNLYSDYPIPTGPNQGMAEYQRQHPRGNVYLEKAGTVTEGVGITTYGYNVWGDTGKDFITFQTPAGLSTYQVGPGEKIGANLKTGELSVFGANRKVPFNYGQVNLTTGEVTRRVPTWGDIEFYKSFTGEAFDTTSKVSPSTYIDYKFSEITNPIGQKILDVSFYNVMTRKVDTEAPAYKFLSMKVPFSITNAGKFLLFAPYMETGAQTYKGIFGNTAVKTSDTVAYLSPLERVKISQALGEFGSSGLYKTIGQETRKEGDSIFYSSITKKSTGAISSNTYSTTELWATGTDRVAGFTRGVTTTNIKSMSGTTFTIGNTFSSSSRIVNIVAMQGGTYEGQMSGIYYGSGRTPIAFGNTNVVSMPNKDYISVLNYQKSSAFGLDTMGFGKSFIMPGRIIEFKTGQITGIGRIYNLKDSFTYTSTGGSIPSGSKGLGILQKSGTVFSSATTGQVQRFSTFSSGGATFTSPQAFDFAYKTGLLFQAPSGSITLQRVTPQERTRTLTGQVLFLSPITTNTIRPIGGQGFNLLSNTRQIPGQTITPIENIRTITPTVPTRIITPFRPTPTNPLRDIGGGMNLPLMPSFDIGGGIGKTKVKRRSKYTPDFPSLIFGRKGKAPTSQIGMLKGRPIPKGFTWAFKSGGFRL